MSSEELDLKELKNPEVISTVTNLQSQINEVERVLTALCDGDPEGKYSKLDAAGKAQHDIFVTYAINSLFWVYLKTKGRDAANHPVKTELGRVREHIARAKQLEERALAPRLDTGVAKRFIRGGLWQPKDKDKRQKEGEITRPNKRKRTFDD